MRYTRRAAAQQPFSELVQKCRGGRGNPHAAHRHAQHRLWPIFERMGFRKVDDRIFHFSDHEYGAFVCDLDVDEKTMPTVFTDPMVLNRPEDRLHMPGILEDSMERGASNPHAEWIERRTN